MTSHPPKKIAILGGGVGSLAAAFGLTEKPGWRDEYEITVYQMGWRLGGKGASGRNPDAGQRIEEHGLHVWAGFYENAFRLMRGCYAEMKRPEGAPLRDWRDAFKPTDTVVLEERVEGGWNHWLVTLPTNDSLPGEGGEFPTLWDYVKMALELIEQLLEPAPAGAGAVASGAAPQAAATEHPSFLSRITHAAERELRKILGHGAAGHPIFASPPPAAGAASVRAARVIAAQLPPDPARHPVEHHQAILWHLEQFRSHPDRLKVPEDDGERRRWILVDLARASLKGFIEDGVLLHGFDAIDGVEWSDWLRRHHAAQATLDSALVRGTYDYIFGFWRGDVKTPSVAAGTCVHGLMRLGFTYKGSLFWKMQAGMGDTVFTPLYECLKARGVRFEFFRRVTHLGLASNQRSIATITVERQATVKAGEYRPLVDVKGLGCWPSAPLYDQLAEGDTLKAKGVDLESAWSDWPGVGTEVLEAGKEFDLVVLGISVGALEEIGAELVAARPAWRQMVDSVRTVQTLAMQLWLRPRTPALGWKLPATMLTAYSEPFDTWADMTHLLPREEWPGTQPGSVAYFCGPLSDAAVIPPRDDHGFPSREKERVRRIAMEWLDDHIAHLWPRSVAPGGQGFDWDALADPLEREGRDRFDAQYWRANVNPTDRYVLSVPGSAVKRLAPGNSGFANLYLAGDWVKTDINAGCVEAATIGGLLASKAICGYPERIVGERG